MWRGKLFAITILGICLYSDTLFPWFSRVFGSANQKSFWEDPILQGALAATAAIYLTALIVLQQRRSPLRLCSLSNPDLWLAAMTLCGVLAFFTNCPAPPVFFDALRFLWAIIFGRIAVIGTVLLMPRTEASLSLLVGLVGLIVAFVIWPSTTGRLGPNPTPTLVSLGFVLVCGLAYVFWSGTRQISGIWHILLAVAALALAGMFFSRSTTGTAAAFFCCCTYVMAKKLYTAPGLRLSKNLFVRKASFISAALIGIAVLYLGSMNVGSCSEEATAGMTEFWQNRSDSWKAFLRLMSDNPWFGHGWTPVETVFQIAQSSRKQPIATNSFLSLGYSAGLLATFCLAAHVFLILCASSGVEQSRLPLISRLQSVCRAGAVVLAFGFFLDGGLFDFRTGVPFWMLLQLSRIEPDENSAPEPPRIPQAREAVLLKIKTRWAQFRTSNPFIARACVGLTSLVAAILVLPPLQVLYVSIADPSTTGPIVVRSISARANGTEVKPAQLVWQPIRNVSLDFVASALALEDDRFFQHNGFDISAIWRSIREAQRTGKPARGASTISQQCARSLFLWQGRSWLRKGLEGYYTIWMELLLSKYRILELYVNCVELGDGIYGVEAASQFYYQVPAKKLTREQAAMLAAVLPNPLKWNALSPSKNLLSRHQQTLQRLENARARLKRERGFRGNR